MPTRRRTRGIEPPVTNLNRTTDQTFSGETAPGTPFSVRGRDVIDSADAVGMMSVAVTSSTHNRDVIMSNYNREEGSYTIPSAEWADLKRVVREAYNDLQERRYKVAVSIWNRLKKDDLDFEDLFEEEATEKGSRRSPFGGGRTEHFVLGDRHFDRKMIRAEIFRKDTDRIYKPRKKAFPKKTNRDTLFDLETIGRPYIQFDNDHRTAYWKVQENNRAVEDARSHPVAQAFFGALGDIEWTRQSGGKVRYQDEYREEAFQGPSIKDRHGPFGKRSQGQTAR